LGLPSAAGLRAPANAGLGCAAVGGLVIASPLVDLAAAAVTAGSGLGEEAALGREIAPLIEVSASASDLGGRPLKPGGGPRRPGGRDGGGRVVLG